MTTINQAVEEKINSLAVAQYAECDRQFTPLWPWVFVRVLPKEQTTRSGIILPAIDMNKTVHEGIVLTTWQPKYVKGEQLVSAFAKGDHVLFPHWAGLPIQGFSEKHYRVIKEVGWSSSTEGGIFARVEYEQEDVSVREKIKRELILNEDRTIEDTLIALEKLFLFVDRDGHSVTLSGR